MNSNKTIREAGQKRANELSLSKNINFFFL